MFPIFPIVGPTTAGLELMWAAITGEIASLVTKNVAKTIWEITKFIFKLAFVIVISFLRSITVDFFSNVVKYWKKDFQS